MMLEKLLANLGVFFTAVRSYKVLGLNILIWDRPEIPTLHSNQYDKVILWRDFSKAQSNFVSIPEIVEKSSITYRDKALLWIYHFGEALINGVKLEKRLTVRENLSAWWLSTIVEKANFDKVPLLDDAVKYICFLDLVNKLNVSDIFLITDKPELVEVLKKYCLGQTVSFKCKLLKKKGII